MTDAPPAAGHGLAIGVDVGGTKVAAGVVDRHGRILGSARRPTPGHEPALVADTIAEVVGELRAAHAVGLEAPIGIGAAGWLDRRGARVMFAPNLAGWRDEPLRDIISARLGRPVVVDNDANTMAWAEYRFGAGRGCAELVCVTVGTGIGSGLVLDGKVRHGAFGVGAEYGHMQVVPAGLPCGCGSQGCWEQYASGRALVRAAREAASGSPQAGRRLAGLAGGDLATLTGPDVTTAAREGDPAAVKCFEEVGYWLGQGLASLAAVLDPAKFVIGGGVSDAGELLLGPARAQFHAALPGRGHRPEAEIVLAELGPDAGFVGAADLARAGILGRA
ncbi:ROK family glucokinase [Frankia sp. CNm7]|uniref:Glucokinase n=1 Tax=Frankia nepalensis TaxID=1836974 RepID=A0A937RI08_9ACTN|nr:ROK family glucokinase [Frankia nepalensis]MBL7500650.1 ROK family glucokinase [Frankia nepalensis]MBL7514187.1 ROK family glucokinase [Frankia nepalensis]MBL7517910.1 ROK family glucokinase [Frankia nepalensis]MBL7632616.1 ROK family glucokinase [Frankia nepalensis]